MKSNLISYLDIWGFEQDFVIFKDGSLGFGLSCSPLDVSAWSDDQLNNLSRKIGNFLNAFPEGLDIQFVQDIEAGNNDVINQYKNYVKVDQDNFAFRMTEDRIQHYKTLDEEGLLPRHGLKIFVRKKLESALAPRTNLFAKPKDFIAISKERLNNEIQLALRNRTDLMSNLEALGVRTSEIHAETLVKKIFQQWNPTHSGGLGSYDPEDIRSNLLFTDVGINPLGFTLSNFHFRVISLKLLPDQTVSTMASQLRELPFDSKLLLTMHVPNQMKELENLKTQRRIAYSMVAGKRGVSDLESEVKFKDLETLLDDMVAQGEKVFHVSINVILRHQDTSVLDDQVSQTLMAFRNMGGAEALQETLASFDIFAQVAMPNARCTERLKKIKTSNLCDLIPLYGPWEGFAEPKILLRSRMGSLIKFDPFGRELSNFNQIVSGGSGSGKSFLTNTLLMQMLKESPKVFFVDIGGSYQKICETFSGQYIPLGTESTFSLNPFDLSPGESRPSNQKIKFLVGLVELMTREEGDKSIGRLERAEIETYIQKVYDEHATPSLRHLQEFLLRHPDKEISRIGKVLGPWCHNTPYGQFIDQKSTIELQKSLVCFDLKGLESHPDLQAVLLMIITDFVWREVQKDRTQMKFLIFDECWKLLENDAGSAFIGEVFRTFRKYMASAIAISQNIDDFAKSKVANAILPNSSVKWILKQKGADQERLKTVLSLNENEAQLISSLTQVKGEYSEAFLMAEDQRCVVAIESTPLEYWVATTDSRDLAAIEEYRKTYPELNTEEIIIKLSRELPKGRI